MFFLFYSKQAFQDYDSESGIGHKVHGGHTGISVALFCIERQDDGIHTCSFKGCNPILHGFGICIRDTGDVVVLCDKDGCGVVSTATGSQVEYGCLFLCSGDLE